VTAAGHAPDPTLDLTPKQAAWQAQKARERGERIQSKAAAVLNTPLSGRAARRAARSGRGDKDQTRRSRVQRQTRRRRTGGVK
jgi:hypothetical protein